MKYDLRDRVLELVRNRPASMTLEKLANETGVNHNWLKKLVAGQIVEPGVSRAWTLYCHLSGKHHDL